MWCSSMPNVTPYEEMLRAIYEGAGGKYDLDPGEKSALNHAAFRGLLKGNITPLIELLVTPAELDAHLRCLVAQMLKDESSTEQRLVLMKTSKLLGASKSQAENFSKLLQSFEVGDVAIDFGANETGQFEAAINATIEYFKINHDRDLKRGYVINCLKETRKNRWYVDLDGQNSNTDA